MTEVAALREALATAIAARAEALATAHTVTGAFGTAQDLHGKATAAMARYAGLDARLGCHRAEAILGGASDYAMPPDLAQAKAERDKAGDEVASLEAAVTHLDAQHTAARSAVASAEQAVTIAAGAVMAAEATATAIRADAMDQEARALWDSYDGLASACPVAIPRDTRNLRDRRPPPPHWVSMQTPIDQMGVPGAKSAAASVNYLTRLRIDSDARADPLASGLRSAGGA